jgi:hypothetical protein
MTEQKEPVQYVNKERTVLVTVWLMDNGTEIMTVAVRETPAHTWGPPVSVIREEAWQ